VWPLRKCQFESVRTCFGNLCMGLHMALWHQALQRSNTVLGRRPWADILTFAGMDAVRTVGHLGACVDDAGGRVGGQRGCELPFSATESVRMQCNLDHHPPLFPLFTRCYPVWPSFYVRTPFIATFRSLSPHTHMNTRDHGVRDPLAQVTHALVPISLRSRYNATSLSMTHPTLHPQSTPQRTALHTDRSQNGYNKPYNDRGPYRELHRCRGRDRRRPRWHRRCHNH
jgi:hypothetical protein